MNILREKALLLKDQIKSMKALIAAQEKAKKTLYETNLNELFENTEALNLKLQKMLKDFVKIRNSSIKEINKKLPILLDKYDKFSNKLNKNHDKLSKGSDINKLNAYIEELKKIENDTNNIQNNINQVKSIDLAHFTDLKCKTNLASVVDIKCKMRVYKKNNSAKSNTTISQNTRWR